MCTGVVAAAAVSPFTRSSPILHDARVQCEDGRGRGRDVSAPSGALLGNMLAENTMMLTTLFQVRTCRGLDFDIGTSMVGGCV